MPTTGLDGHVKETEWRIRRLERSLRSNTGWAFPEELPKPNICINGTGRTNQRGYVSGTPSLPGIYMVDRWKAVGVTTTKNYVTNPSIETATTGWTALPGTSGVAALTSAAPSTTTAYGTKVLKCTWSTATTASSLAGVYYDITAASVGLVAGDIISMALYHIKSSIDNRLRTKVEFRDITNTFISQVTGTEFQVTAGTIYSAADTAALKQENITVPAATVTIRLYVSSLSGTGYQHWSIGSYLEVDGAMVNKAATAFPYFDGSTTHTTDYAYSWAGTADASVSNRVSVSEVAQTRNCAPNPSVETNTTGFFTQAGTGGTTALTSAAPSTTTAYGTKVLKSTWSVASTAGGGMGYYIETSTAGLAVGDVISVALYHAKSSIAQNLRMTVAFYNVGAFISQTNGTTKAFTAGTIYSATSDSELKLENLTIPATTTRVYIYLLSQGSVPWTIGSYLEADGLMINEGATSLAYFDGATTDTASYDYQWLGVANASPSIRINATSLTFTSAPQGQTMTISAGGAVAQVAERANIRAGEYVLSWPGTALGRVYTAGTTAPAYAASPVVATLDGTDNAIMEFGAGTLSVGDEGVKFEFGGVATPFLLEDVAVERARCYWYFQALVVGSNEYVGVGTAYLTTGGFGIVNFFTPMRIAPTVSRSAASDFGTFTAAGAGATLTAFTFQEVTPRRARFNTTVASGLTVGQGMIVQAITANARVYADSEL